MSVADNLRSICQAIETALQRSGRDPGDATLLAVSKTWPPERIYEAFAAGQFRFGESRVQEAVAKIPQLPGNGEWHFIGHLQKNKIRKILPHCQVLHSIDSLPLAEQVNRIAGELGLFPRIYLEVNVSRDGSKHGFSPEGVRADLDALLSLDRLQIEGLMTIPALGKQPEDARPHFAALRDLRDDLETQAGTPLGGLSMGMSRDFEIAIEEGSTIVRVGSAIFGTRNPAHHSPTPEPQIPQ